jgi:glucoamylase
MDETAFPLVLAYQLHRQGPSTYRNHIRPAARFIVNHGPATQQERWEEQSGFSPSTIAAEIAGLVCAAHAAAKNGDMGAARRFRAVADRWRSNLNGWTVTRNGPLADHPYYLRLTKNGRPNSGMHYDLGNGRQSSIDQRRVLDAGFLELVRLGIKKADNHVVRESLPVINRHLRVMTPNGPFWHRYTSDGYGETHKGGEWDVSDPNTFETVGRAWPIFTGERGEYKLAAGRKAMWALRTMARAANDGHMLSEQVWDQHLPSGHPGFRRGEGTFSATPLAWTHAQFIRLAWSIDAGKPVETPRVVACRYVARNC